MGTNDINVVSEKNAWGDKTHAKVFDYLHPMPGFIVKKHYESFNEGRLLRMFENDIHGNIFFEIGCATGELSRYISGFQTRFKYYGFDISDPAIARAKQKYPMGNFHKVTDGFEEIIQTFGHPDVVWCRDVVMHQELPYVFLDNLINLSNEVVILRLRTRDVGETITDPELSCQLHWDKFWVPYIVLNTDEMIQEIEAHQDVKKIVISRHYEVLGGHNFRFLPKELFFSYSGTAETAVYIQKGSRKDASAEVSFMDQPDRPKYGIIERIIRKCFSELRARRDK
ncbi:MAG: class I SAM-dependent methyltransferase [Deltaproteobacteria bacterium]|nr:class I SAM-dependent methyltransferase [Deltaproteobacteria bacterium]